MKKQIIALSVAFLTLATFAQKDEIKAAEKALKKKDYTTVLSSLKPLESSEASMEAKYKAKYFFLKGQALEGNDELENAADTYNSLFDYEKEVGKPKYTKLAKPMLDGIIAKVSNKAVKAYNDDKDYPVASEQFALVYKLSPKDTTFLFNAAISSYLYKDYDLALKHFKTLKDLNYTGIATQYLAVNKETGETENLGAKTNRDTMVKLGQYENPTEKITESRRGDIVKNVAYILVTQGKTEEAIEALEAARKENPTDVNLVMNEAQMYIDLDRMDKFTELMEEATKLDPTNHLLFYNLGVVNANGEKYDEAIKYYEKAIELKEDYRDAYLNLGVAYLNKRIPVINEMNDNLSNAKKYDALELKLKELYKQALPYLEKADGLERTIETVQNLLNIYDSLEMTSKADELRPIYKEMKNN